MKTLGVDELIDLCKRKDEAAQMEIYQRFHLAMFHTALRIVNHSVDAEDIMHDAFLAAFEKLHQYRGENKFGGWLKQITVRKAINFYEKNKPLVTSDFDEEIPSEETPFPQAENSQIKQLQMALNQLIPRYRNVLILMYMEGYDYEELSEILDLSYGNCRTLVSRAKEQLKQKMTAHEIQL